MSRRNYFIAWKITEILTVNARHRAIHIIDDTAYTMPSMLLSPLLQLGRHKSSDHIKTLHGVFFFSARVTSIMHLHKWYESQYYAPCDTVHFTSVDEMSAKYLWVYHQYCNFHSGNAQHLRMQRPSHEVLQQPTAMCSSKFMPGHTICHIGISRRIPKEQHNVVRMILNIYIYTCIYMIYIIYI